MQRRRTRIRAFASLGLLAFGLSSARAQAQTFFNPPANLSGDQLWSNYLHVVDLNGDGHLDVIVANSGGFFSTPQAQAFQIFVGSGSGTFFQAFFW